MGKRETFFLIVKRTGVSASIEEAEMTQYYVSHSRDLNTVKLIPTLRSATWFSTPSSAQVVIDDMHDDPINLQKFKLVKLELDFEDIRTSYESFNPDGPLIRKPFQP